MRRPKKINAHNLHEMRPGKNTNHANTILECVAFLLYNSNTLGWAEAKGPHLQRPYGSQGDPAEVQEMQIRANISLKATKLLTTRDPSVVNTHTHRGMLSQVKMCIDISCQHYQSLCN